MAKGSGPRPGSAWERRPRPGSCASPGELPGAPTAVDWAPLDGVSLAVREVCRRAGLVADRRLRVLIEGEPGTGKLRLARALHWRAGQGELGLVGCVAGVWRIAWRRALSRCDTLVLLHPEALDRREQLELAVHVAVLDRGPWLIGVSRSAGDLDPALAQRLGCRIRIPPLRDRPEDLDALVVAWCEEAAASGPRPAVAPEAMAGLRSWAWAGNVGELRNVLAAAWLASGGAIIGPEHLERRPVAPTWPLTLRDLERQAIERALERSHGSVTDAARELGISRATLHRRLSAYRRLDHGGSAEVRWLR
jgi:hypothetical protein